MPTIVRSANQVHVIADAEPFPDNVIASAGPKVKVHVILSARTTKAGHVVSVSTDDDRPVADGTENAG